MPVSKPTALLAALMEQAINRLLWLDPETLERLGQLDGKVVAVQLQSEHVSADQQLPRFYCYPSESGLRIKLADDLEHDVTIAGNLPVFTKLILGDNAPTGLAAGELKISGDFDLGHRFKKILDRIEIDWEETLSHYVGDIGAHKLANFARRLRHWGKHAHNTVMRDVVEYFQEETRDLPKQREVEQFIRSVDDIRADVERLQQRLQRLGEMH